MLPTDQLSGYYYMQPRNTDSLYVGLGVPKGVNTIESPVLSMLNSREKFKFDIVEGSDNVYTIQAPDDRYLCVYYGSKEGNMSFIETNTSDRDNALSRSNCQFKMTEMDIGGETNPYLILAMDNTTYGYWAVYGSGESSGSAPYGPKSGDNVVTAGQGESKARSDDNFQFLLTRA